MKHRDSILDLVRGVSALLVMLGHLRGFLFLDFGELAGAGILTKLFYFATGLGHQAVMVFFVLSGYFVGGSVMSGVRKGVFSWSGYAVSRLTRLWMVLVPALLLTLAVDMLGRQWNHGAYAGAMHPCFMSGPMPDRPAAWDIVTLIGNLGFLQTVTVPVFGSNGPLWSLANEFWYYLMFPLLACGLQAFFVKRPGLGVAQLVAAICLMGILPRGLVAGGIIWVMGAGVWWVVRRAQAPPHTNDGRPAMHQPAPRFKMLLGWWRVLGGLLFFCSLAASKTSHWMGSDLVIGGVFAMWLLALPGGWKMPRWFTRMTTGLSEISYTLYVVHFPLLFFVAAVLLHGRQFPASAQGYLWFAGLALAILAFSAGMWWIFERNTDRMRKWLLSGGWKREC